MADPYISEIQYAGSASDDFIEIVVDAGTDVSDIFVTIYNADGTIQAVYALGTPVATISGQDVYIINAATLGSFGGLSSQDAVALEQGGSLLSFFSFNHGPAVTATEGIASGVTSTKIGKTSGGGSLETNNGGASYFVQATPNPGTVPCLCAGSLVETADGPVLVQNLKPGALVRTFDGDFIALNKILGRKVSYREMLKNPKLFPIRIAAGAMGDKKPNRDMLVSRQHRMLVGSPISERINGDYNVLVSAIHLTAHPGINIDTAVGEVEYFHLLFDDHAVILVDGTATESLLLRTGAIEALGQEQANDIRATFPDLLKDPPKPRFQIPAAQKQKRLVERHLKNAKPFQSFSQIGDALVQKKQVVA